MGLIAIGYSVGWVLFQCVNKKGKSGVIDLSLQLLLQ